MKKFLSIFVSLVLIIFQIDAIKVFASTMDQSGDYKYSISNSTAKITGYTGSGGNITIPSTIGEYTVTSIDNSAFYGCTNLTSITIPSSVTSIGNSAFSECFNLTNITIPNSVTSIGDEAFNGCVRLSNITIPSGVTSIGAHMFDSCCNLKSIIISNNVTSIGVWAFEGCSSLTSITIPNSVTSIGDNAFADCSNLTSITIPSSVTSIGDDAFYGCTKLTSITIPNSVTSIGNGTFRDCSSLTSITIPNSVTSIGNGTFRDCSSLTSITIPNSVTSIGNGTFRDCSSLTSIIIPSSITSIDDYAFYECTKLTSITIPSGVTSIGDNAFEDCSNLRSIKIPSSVTSIGDSALYGCKKLITIDVDAENTVYSSLDGVLYNKLKTILISYPSGKTNSTFFVPSSVTSIGDHVFYCCSSLTSIIIPVSVTHIGYYTFLYCPSNLVIYYHKTSIDFTNVWYGHKTVTYNLVTYNGNGNTGGTVPVDNNIYIQGNIAATLKNTNSLVKTGYTFSGWNTAADGSGTSYPEGTALLMKGIDVTLYAQWITISPAAGTFAKASPANLVAAITAPNKATNPVVGVYNGDTKLVGGTDEAVTPTATGYTLTLYKSYLSKLTSNAVITVKFKNGSSLTYTITLGASISPASGTFTKTVPANLMAAITAPNKATNPVVGVYNGDAKLVGGTDEAVAPTTTGYTLTLYKSYLSKLTSNSVITLKFKDGSSINYTVNIK